MPQSTNKYGLRLFLARTTPYVLTALILAGFNASARSAEATPEDFKASGSTDSITCQAVKDSAYLTCAQWGDFLPGQGVMLKGAGYLPHGGSYPVTPAPTFKLSNANASGTNTYCYRIAVADPFQGIQTASPATCIANQPLVSHDRYHEVTVKRFSESLRINNITPPNPAPAPAWAYSRVIPVYLLYTSLNDGPYQLTDVSNDPNGDVTFIHVADTRPNGDFGGWPAVLPSTQTADGVIQRGNLFAKVLSYTAVRQGGVKYRLDKPSQITGSVALIHDDTDAFQKAIDFVTGNGGGTVKLQAKTYNIQKPYFGIDFGRTGIRGYTSDLYTGPAVVWWGGALHLHLSADSVTNGLAIEGSTSEVPSVIKTGPDLKANLLSLVTLKSGELGIPAVSDRENHIRIWPADKGDQIIRLVDPSDLSKLRIGSDLYLFSGNFDPTSATNPSYKPTTKAQGSNFSELNTVADIDAAGVVTLALPLTKKYWFDGYNSFGVSPMAEPVPRNVSIKHITFDTTHRILSSGPAFNLTIDHVTSLRPIPGNAMGTGYKRGLTITNSNWSFGNGGKGWDNTNEFDKTADVVFDNNTIRGYAAKFTEGPSQGAKISFTEGATNLRITNNHFVGVQLAADEVDDVVIDGNVFEDSVAWIGQSEKATWGLKSFASQHNASISNNEFAISNNYGPSGAIRLGNFDGAASITNNKITWAQDFLPLFTMIEANSGTIERNEIYDTRSFALTQRKNNSFVTLSPDINPNPIVFRNNSMFGDRAVQVAEVLPTQPIENQVQIEDVCIKENIVNGQVNNSLYIRYYLWHPPYDFRINNCTAP